MVRFEGVLGTTDALIAIIRSKVQSLQRTWRQCLLYLMGRHLIHTTQRGVEIFVERGTKPQSAFDFVVKYKEPGQRARTPKHVHLIVELYVKEAYNRSLTHALRDHLIWVFDQIKPLDAFPPRLQIYQPSHVNKFIELDNVGEYSVEFLLVVSELIFIQEKTNYPQGSLTKRLYEAFGVKDRFSVIQMATYR